jgi:hypothetical protein
MVRRSRPRAALARRSQRRGITAVLFADAVPAPATLRAVTVNRYATPLVSPPTVSARAPAAAVADRTSVVPR